jgi:RNAse (barnase) inhibitor barstar
MAKKIYQIDGQLFSTLEEFYEHFSKAALQDYDWGKNLNAFNDVLRGGFGTPDEGFILLWKNVNISRERLGYDETIRQLRHHLQICHSSNRELVANDLEKAIHHDGPTVFDWLVEIIRDHEDIELRLE